MSCLLNIKDDIFRNILKYFIYFRRDIVYRVRFKLISSASLQLSESKYFQHYSAFDFPLEFMNFSFVTHRISFYSGNYFSDIYITLHPRSTNVSLNLAASTMRHTYIAQRYAFDIVGDV